MDNKDQNSPVVPIQDGNQSSVNNVVEENQVIRPVVDASEQANNVQSPVTPVAEQPTPVVEKQEVLDSNEGVVQNIPEESNVVEESNNQEEDNKLNNNDKDNNSGPSGFAKFMTIILFLFFFALVYFLPEITDYINLQKSLKNKQEITTGRLICKNSKSSESLDIQMEASFDFTDLKLIRLTHITTSSGDKIEDKEELEQLRNDCSVLKNEVGNYDGISVICSLNGGVNVVKQTLNYEMIKQEEMTAAYAEAGGIYADFKYQDDIKKIESKMTSSGYTCETVSY